MSTNRDLVEAVDQLNELEKAYLDKRRDVADLLRIASQTQQVTNLARLTKINRATIYWLIKTWSRDADSDN